MINGLHKVSITYSVISKEVLFLLKDICDIHIVIQKDIKLLKKLKIRKNLT